MDSVPTNASGQAHSSRNVEGRHSHPSHKTKRKKLNLKIILALVGGFVLVAILTFSMLFMYKSSTVANIDSGKYQAVFFTNGQVYFGKLQTLNSSYMKLTDIFYLQAKAETATTDSENPQETTQDASGVELIKLGSEIHGPEDEMVISKDQILFFENLKNDGTVAESISKYQSQQK